MSALGDLLAPAQEALLLDLEKELVADGGYLQLRDVDDLLELLELGFALLGCFGANIRRHFEEELVPLLLCLIW